jgi:hypothetical protein
MSESRLPTDFGLFYPTGWIVAAFPSMQSAGQVQRDLLMGGYNEEDCKLVRCDEVVPVAEGQLENAGWLARLGKTDELVQKQLDAAKRGSAFLIVFAPTDPEAERVMNVVRRVPFEFAHRYHRFAIQTLD